MFIWFDWSKMASLWTIKDLFYSLSFIHNPFTLLERLDHVILSNLSCHGSIFQSSLHDHVHPFMVGDEHKPKGCFVNKGCFIIIIISSIYNRTTWYKCPRCGEKLLILCYSVSMNVTKCNYSTHETPHRMNNLMWKTQIWPL